jgi:hypothetical protein
MGGLSIWHWIIVLTFSVVWLVPLWRIVGKAGFPGPLSLLALVPLVNVVLLWVFAFVRWPVERDAP